MAHHGHPPINSNLNSVWGYYQPSTSGGTAIDPTVWQKEIYDSYINTAKLSSVLSAVTTTQVAKPSLPPRVNDELHSLAVLAGVAYALSRNTDGITISLGHDNKFPLGVTCRESELEPMFRAALNLYLLPHMDRK